MFKSQKPPVLWDNMLILGDSAWSDPQSPTAGREVGKFLNMRGYSAIRRADEGQRIVDSHPYLWDLA